jgi:uncharacterized protein (UPF0276 family)
MPRVCWEEQLCVSCEFVTINSRCTDFLRSTGCFMLLDLHNIYCNALNHGINPFATIDKLPLDRVLEIHIAGGASRDGFWMDGHNGSVPEPVWELLEYTLPRTPNVAGVVFEMLDEFAVRFGADAIGRELLRSNEIWNRYRAS